jgi:hypothetical protein
MSFILTAQDSSNVDCKFRTNEVDEFTGTSKLVLEKERFIQFTDSSLIKYYKKKPHQYIEMDLYCAKMNDLYVAYTYWRVDSDKAYKYFGSISTSSKIIFKFTDGTTLELNYSNYDSGDTKYDGGYTTYSSYLLLSDEQIEIIKSKEIEKLRMYWNNGYEDYPCYNGGLFSKQLKCLN